VSKRLCTVLLLICAATTQAEVLDDPMRPPMLSQAGPAAVKKEVAGFYLSSTLIAQGRRYAVINGRRVEVGDRINRAKVEEILPARVKLRYAGKSQTIHMLPITVKKPSKGNRP
jgi:hypothetical protein